MRRIKKKPLTAFLLTAALTISMTTGTVHATELDIDETEVIEEVSTTETAEDVENLSAEELTEANSLEDGISEVDTLEVDTPEVDTLEVDTPEECILETENPVENTETEVEQTSVPVITYKVHRQDYGDTDWLSAGQPAGTVGEAKRLEAITINVTGEENVGVTYRTHVQNLGWQDWRTTGGLSGTTGKALRLEAIQIKLTGENASKYSIFYRVHAQNYGWLDWACNGAIAGTSGQSLRLEAIEVIIVPASELTDGVLTKAEVIKKYAGKEDINDCLTTTPAVTLGSDSDDEEGSFGKINYFTHVQDFGDQKWVYDGSISGTYGKAKRLEAISIKLGNIGYEGGVRYKTHVQNEGWLDWVEDGEMSGTTGKAYRLEAIQIELTGEVANHYDIYYRVHTQNFGWLDWACNGEPAGSAGYAYRLEGIQIVLVPTGEEISSATVAATLGTKYGVKGVCYIDANSGVEKVLAYAYEHLGAPYQYAGTNIETGVDCSGFTMLCYQQIGISLPHNSDMQGNYGRQVSEKEMLPGDLIIYPDHVALYVGDGQIIHASTPQTGVKLSRYNYKTIKKIVRIVG